MGEPKQNMQTLISQFSKEASSNRDVHPGLRVGFGLANGSMSSNQSGDCPARSASSKPKAKPQSLPRQRNIHRALIKADLVDCMVALPGQLFYSTQIPVEPPNERDARHQQLGLN